MWATGESRKGLVIVLRILLLFAFLLLNLTREQRVLRARKAAHTRWSQEDPAGTAIAGQAGLRGRFLREVREAEPGLTEAEYGRRAEHAFKAYMAGLALKSSKARGARKAGGGDGS